MVELPRERLGLPRPSSAVANDNHDPLDEFVADYLRAADARLRAKASVPRAARRFLPREVIAARRRLYTLGSILIVCWGLAVALPFLMAAGVEAPGSTPASTLHFTSMQTG
jgi:hypothetical protein